ncbi:hypothetical protein ABZ443_13380, partial [Streptomyces shenzhenensis]
RNDPEADLTLHNRESVPNATRPADPKRAALPDAGSAGPRSTGSTATRSGWASRPPSPPARTAA